MMKHGSWRDPCLTRPTSLRNIRKRRRIVGGGHGKRIGGRQRCDILATPDLGKGHTLLPRSHDQIGQSCALLVAAVDRAAAVQRIMDPSSSRMGGSHGGGLLGGRIRMAIAAAVAAGRCGGNGNGLKGRRLCGWYLCGCWACHERSRGKDLVLLLVLHLHLVFGGEDLHAIKVGFELGCRRFPRAFAFQLQTTKESRKTGVRSMSSSSKTILTSNHSNDWWLDVPGDAEYVPRGVAFGAGRVHGSTILGRVPYTNSNSW